MTDSRLEFTEKEVDCIVKLQNTARQTLKLRRENDIKLGPYADWNNKLISHSTWDIRKKWDDKLPQLLKLDPTVENAHSYNELITILVKRGKKVLSQSKKIRNFNGPDDFGVNCGDEYSMIRRYKKLTHFFRKLSKVNKKLEAGDDEEFESKLDEKICDKLFSKIKGKVDSEITVTSIRILMVYLDDNDAHILLSVYDSSTVCEENRCSCKRNLCNRVSKLSAKSTINLMNLFFDVQREKSIKKASEN